MIKTPVIVGRGEFNRLEIDDDEGFIVVKFSNYADEADAQKVAAALNALHGYRGPVWEGMVSEMAKFIELSADMNPGERGYQRRQILDKLRPAAEGGDG